MEIPEKDYEHIKRLANKYYGRSFSYISAEDLLQEGLLAYTLGAKNYDPKVNGYYMGFIYKRVLGAMLDYIAKASVNGTSTVRGGDNSRGFKVVPCDSVQLVVNEEDKILDEMYIDLLYTRFFSYIDKLPEAEKQALELYFLEGLSMTDTAKRVSIEKVMLKEVIEACVATIREYYPNSATGEINYHVLSRM